MHKGWGFVVAGLVAPAGIATAAPVSAPSVYVTGTSDAAVSTTFVPVLAGQVQSIDEENQWGMAVIGGAVWAWGDNRFGQLGDGSTVSSQTPVRVRGLRDVIRVDGGDDYALALEANGTVWSWGADLGGELGNGTTGGYDPLPRRIDHLRDVVAVTAGSNHSMALLADGMVETWGAGGFGNVLGNGQSGHQDTPELLRTLHDITAISAGCSWSLALDAQGRVWSWGLNTYGQLGNGTTASEPLPGRVAGLPRIKAISAGGDDTTNGHGLALDEAGHVWAWGDNADGQVGDPEAGPTVPSPVELSLTAVSAVSAGGTASAAVDPTGRLYVWGDDSEGQLGTGGGPDLSTPTRSNLAGVLAVSAGSKGTAALAP